MGVKIKTKIDTSSLFSIEDDIRKYATNILRNTTGEIRDELTEQATWAIARFYMDYTPGTAHIVETSNSKKVRPYQRHYYNFMDKSYRKYYSNAHGNIFRGGVEFTPELMDSIYGTLKNPAPTEQVFDMVYAGMHGPSTAYWGVPPVMSPSPMELIEFKKEEIEDNIQEYIDRNIIKSKNDNYKFLKFR